jgi:diguanylate cyclase (GGDEF)-like protein
LIRVSERLLATARRGDTVARLGGDEFTVLMEDNDDATELAGRVLAALDSPISFGSRTIKVSASIGIAVVRPEDPTLSATEMFRHVDLALYAAKRAGKATISSYHAALDTHLVDAPAMD